MQKIYYERKIDLLHRLKELVSLSVDESINYKIEDNGVRAVGDLIIKGEYLSDSNKLFVENVELDILATNDKIVDQRDFNIKVEDFDYQIIDGNLEVSIEVGVHGVIDGEDRYISDDDTSLEEIEALTREIEAEPEEEPVIIEESGNANEVNSSIEETVYQTIPRDEDKDEDKEVGTYYLYVVSPNDTYHSIALRYKVDEDVIRDYNQNALLESGQVIIIPYVPTKAS